jgi:hypothetical protein
LERLRKKVVVACFETIYICLEVMRKMTITSVLIDGLWAVSVTA